MDNKILSFIDSTIWLTFLALVTITPLIFTTQTSELFEVPKMIFVYLGATIILFSTLVKFALHEKITLPKNLAFYAFILFLFIQFLSTLTSIDKFTSVYGYPTRLNGGLLSQISYLVIFGGILVNLKADRAKKLLIAAIISAFAVALWGIPSHFGYDPSCLVLTGQLNANCWQIDFNPTLRIFSTMGQANWLASYLILLLPFSVTFALLYKSLVPRIYFLVISLCLFLAFIFTNSRAGLLGLIVSLLVFISLLGAKTILKRKKVLIPSLLVIAVIFAIFGTTLRSRFFDLKNVLFNNSQNAGPTESASIRLIVWQGANDIFRHYPILGTGPETFAYSYYLFRPAAHNQTTEWNFFYNKAHNEFLNYAANNGIFGSGSYLLLLIISVYLLIKLSRSQNFENSTLSKAAIASIFGYQISIFFGFSTVATQLLAYTTIASVLTLETENHAFNIPFPNNFIKITTASAVVIIEIFAISFPLRIFFADYFYNNAQKAETQKAQLANYQKAIQTYPTANPFYWIALSESLAQAAQTDNQFTQIADKSAQKALKFAPKNTQVVRQTGQTYIDIANNDSKYSQKAISTNQKLTEIAPTDPQAYLALAKADVVASNFDEAKLNLQKTLSLKNDYPQAIDLLAQLNSKSYNKNDTAPQN